LRQKLEQAESGAAQAPPVRPPPAVLAAVPWDLVQEAIGAKSVVFLGFFVRQLFKALQDEMRGQRSALIEEIVEQLQKARQDATDRARRKLDAASEDFATLVAARSVAGQRERDGGSGGAASGEALGS
jgi:hypothetical protein